MKGRLGHLPVHLSEYVPVGTLISLEGRIVAHPLDLIAFQHPHDPLGRLDAAMAWILDRANRRLDAVEARVSSHGLTMGAASEGATGGNP